ncbi:hypothetical protein ACIBF6_23115 [Streptosporangium amethystogenes]|uniref:hypothetical protein n=1 Tax=Streptosporangium amethystogenes TaxID=2002 RepID=UPI0037A4C234
MQHVVRDVEALGLDVAGPGHRSGRRRSAVWWAGATFGKDMIVTPVAPGGR